MKNEQEKRKRKRKRKRKKKRKTDVKSWINWLSIEEALEVSNSLIITIPSYFAATTALLRAFFANLPVLSHSWESVF